MNNFVNIKTSLGSFNLDIKLEIVNGINCLFGPSGSGKTSIINCIAGLIKPKFAKIEINGKILNNTKEKFFCPIHKRNIGYVFQDARLFPHLKVINNLTYGEIFSKNRENKFNKNDIIELLNLKKLLSRYPYNLSGGEKQRVAIGRALLSQPKLIIMDEPLASLDQKKKNELLNYIVKIFDTFKIPIIYVSHSSTETFLIGHKINFLSKGQIVFQGNKNQAYNYFNKEYTENLADNFLRGKVLKVNNNDNITEISLGKQKLLIFTNNFKKGEVVLLRIKATDLIICKTFPKNVSSLNYLLLKISNIIVNKSLVTVCFSFKSGLFKAHITKMSLNRLKLKKGDSCYVLIKAININDVMSYSLI